jgi:hypothetical protein
MQKECFYKKAVQEFTNFCTAFLFLSVGATCWGDLYGRQTDWNQFFCPYGPFSPLRVGDRESRRYSMT